MKKAREIVFWWIVKNEGEKCRPRNVDHIFCGLLFLVERVLLVVTQMRYDTCSLLSNFVWMLTAYTCVNSVRYLLRHQMRKLGVKQCVPFTSTGKQCTQFIVLVTFGLSSCLSVISCGCNWLNAAVPGLLWTPVAYLKLVCITIHLPKQE